MRLAELKEINIKILIVRGFKKFAELLSSPILLWTLVGVTTLLTYLRIYFGTDVSDEAYYVACALLTAIGGKPYTNDMYFQQNASLLYEPIVFIYNRIIGTTGVILFVRHLYFILAMGCSTSFYCLFRRLIKSDQAAIVSLLPITFIFGVLPSLSYNTISSLCFGMGMALTINGLLSKKFYLQAWGSVSLALATFAYPSFGFGAFLFLLTGLAWSWRTDKAIFKSLFISAIICAFVFGGLWTLTLSRFGYQNLLDSIQLTRDFGAMGNPMTKLHQAFDIFRLYCPPTWCLGLILVGIFGISLFALNWLWAMPLIGLSFLLTSPVSPEALPSHVFLSMICLLGLPSILLGRRNWDRNFIVSFSIVVPSVLMAFLVGWTSANTAYTTALTSQFAVIAILFLGVAKAPRSLTFLAMVFLHGPLLFWNYKHVYRDNPIGELTMMMQSGPYAGLLTTAERKQVLTEVESDINEMKKKANSILFYDYFPAGYLFSNLRPATRSVYIHQLPYGLPARHMYTQFYQDPKNRPDVFFQFESFPIFTNTYVYFRPEMTKSPEDDFYDMLSNTGDYKLIQQRKHYKVWLKKTL